MESEIFSQLEKHRYKLLNFVQKHIKDGLLAEDVLQDSLLKAIKSSPDLKDEDKLLPWFYRILKNSIIDVYRGRTNHVTSVENSEHILSLLTSPESSTDEEICSCFYELLPGLKPEYAELIKRIDLNGESTQQVAFDLKIKSNNLKVRHHRARQSLKRRLEEACRLCAVHHCLDCTCSKQ